MSEATNAVAPPLQDEIRRVATVPTLLVCSDFDGTLSAIVPVPDDARPIPGVVDVLDAIAELPATQCLLISGRTVADLRVLSGVGDSVVLVGSHGAEFSDGYAVQVDARQRGLRDDIVQEVTAITAGVPGARLEPKPISVAVHVRQASRADAARVLAAVRAGPAVWPGVHVTEGKEVIELSVQPVNKGTAILGMKQRCGADAVLFLGDDVTDERGFAALAPGDVGVKVGTGETAAGYRVGDPEAALAVLVELLSGRRAAQP